MLSTGVHLPAASPISKPVAGPHWLSGTAEVGLPAIWVCPTAQICRTAPEVRSNRPPGPTVSAMNVRATWVADKTLAVSGSGPLETTSAPYACSAREAVTRQVGVDGHQHRLGS